MKITPINFTGPRVAALLEKRKTQTRRIIKPQPACHVDCAYKVQHLWQWRLMGGLEPADLPLSRCPYGAPGDLLWVKEGFSPYADETTRRYCQHYDRIADEQSRPCVYRADHPDNMNLECGGDGRWRHHWFMPRRYSRITLELTEVRVQRARELSWNDALAEGVSPGIIPACGDHPDLQGYMMGKDDGKSPLSNTPQEAFRKSWIALHGPDSWDKWVWALSFTVHLANVNTVAAKGAAV